jgi:uncharacterized protein (TIGR00730 family)
MKLAHDLGALLAERGHKLIYGGGSLGLMGAVASASFNAGGSVLGIMPDFLSDIEKTSYEINHIIVKDMHARKMMMYNKSDAFIVLPGGIGTLEEAVEILSWSRLNLHNKPIVFLDNTNYWDSILKLLNSMSEEGFIPSSFLKKIIFNPTPASTLREIERLLENIE